MQRKGAAVQATPCPFSMNAGVQDIFHQSFRIQFHTMHTFRKIELFFFKTKILNTKAKNRLCKQDRIRHPDAIPENLPVDLLLVILGKQQNIADLPYPDSGSKQMFSGMAELKKQMIRRLRHIDFYTFYLSFDRLFMDLIKKSIPSNTPFFIFRKQHPVQLDHQKAACFFISRLIVLGASLRI